MSPSEDDVQALYEYCARNGIEIHPSIRPKHVPGRGLGIYAAKAIGQHEHLVRVPVGEIFTTESIPETFLSRAVREGIAVHAQLAAFFAFGRAADLEPYKLWIATWPGFADFYEAMPIFWGQSLADTLDQFVQDKDHSGRNTDLSRPAVKRQKVLNGSSSSEVPASALRTSTAGRRKGDWADGLLSLSVIHEQVRLMAEKLATHLCSIEQVLPNLHILETPEKLAKFLHAWCLVNTRCFYYVPSLPSSSRQKGSKMKAPADPNEAMGLCPFMDLFNHTAASEAMLIARADSQPAQSPCKVSSGLKGFIATTTCQIGAGNEVVFSYGSHTNDTLWSEYGFLLSGSSNSSDSVLLDQIILKQITEEHRVVLEEHDYLGSYTLLNDGSVCYRTEMVAWCLILGPEKWTRCAEEGLDPGDMATSTESSGNEDQQLACNRTGSPLAQSSMHQHYRLLEKWLTDLQEQADSDISDLAPMEDGAVLKAFASVSIMGTTLDIGSAERQLSLARRRHGMCIERCKQISAMAARGIEASNSALSEGNPG